ncbi:ATP-binding protein [Candidatus Pelagibacter sp.]|uniref:sensor histidine kinase NtrY-like n=1 Tax=Candidatus Pelagibacter sp. TaxID=2024849 RepID=UPI003F859D9A
MLEFLKKNIIIIILSSITLFLGFLTFLTFIDRSFVDLNEKNLQYLLISNIFLLILLFIFIFVEVKNSIKIDIDKDGLTSNKKYITYFSLFTLIPSILISIFSLFLFSFALEKYFDKKVTTVVNNSYELAKNYVEEVRNKIQSDIILIAFDTNKSANFLNENAKEYLRFLRTQKLIRNVDEIHIIDKNKKLLYSTEKKEKYIPPVDKALNLVLEDDRPLKIIDTKANISAAIMRLQSSKDRFIYVVKFLDKDISNYLAESQEAINFYYTVEDRSTGIKISFFIIYIIIVSLLLFISITIAIRFSSRFFRSINNLILASTEIGHGNLNTKVPEIKTDKDMEVLNKNFNSMISRLKNQQEKLIVNERYKAWGNLSRKLAHEIKNPLTPIQLTIDRIRTKYTGQITNEDQQSFKENLKIINSQIKQIENLVNEFSDFARMPKPTLKRNNLVKLLNENIKLLSEINKSIEINFNKKNDEILLECDKEQISRVFINLIKNSIESIEQKVEKNPDFKKKILIDISSNNDHILISLEDNGVGFDKNNIKEILNPYYTTKKNGTGLGLSIVNKIINDHKGELEFIPINNGAKIQIRFYLNDNRNINS